jgi:DNA-binding winged helix-turn-helix (wHTH) protein
VNSMETRQRGRIVSFGCFQADLHAAELYRNGVKIKLQKQPFQVLAILLQRPGDLVTREELRSLMWPSDTFVDFEHSLNVAVRRLRESLGDDAERPVFIETLPRRGYRFLAPVTPEVESRIRRGNAPSRRTTYLIAALGVLLACTVGIVRWALLFRLRSETTEAGIPNQGTSPPPMPVRKERGASPAGTYLDSCRDEVVQGRTLTAVCQKLSGTWQTTTLQDLSQCEGDIWNVDGYLSCDLRKNLSELPDPDLDPNRYYIASPRVTLN